MGLIFTAIFSALSVNIGNVFSFTLNAKKKVVCGVNFCRTFYFSNFPTANIVIGKVVFRAAFM